MAFFTDILPVNLFSTTGTLDIEITEEVSKTRYHLVAGVERYQVGEEIRNLNPGDILEITYGIENEGNKSAWIRTLIDITIGLNAEGSQPETPGIFKLYALGVDRDEIREGLAGDPLAISTAFGFSFTSEIEIINGIRRSG